MSARRMFVSRTRVATTVWIFVNRSEFRFAKRLHEFLVVRRESDPARDAFRALQMYGVQPGCQIEFARPLVRQTAKIGRSVAA